MTDSAAVASPICVLARSVEVGPKAILLGPEIGRAAGLPSWRDICANLIVDLGLPAGEAAADPSAVIRTHSQSHPLAVMSAYRRWHLAQSESYLTGGYSHLANLVRQGDVDLVLTLDWDPAIELAIAKVMRLDEYRVLSRGETSDSALARAVEHRLEPLVVKLGGNPHARLLDLPASGAGHLSPDLVSSLKRSTSGRLVVIGDVLSDNDARRILPAGFVGPGSWYVRPQGLVDSRPHGSGIVTDGESVSVIDGDSGRFDNFFTVLDLEVQRLRCAGPGWPGLQVQASMIMALDSGSASLGYSTVTQYVAALALKLMSARPDLLVFLDDPLAPGGTEIQKRLLSTALGTLPQATLAVITDLENRVVVNRRVELPLSLPIDDPARVLVIDAVAFSGTTLQMGVEYLRALLPGAEVIPATLVVSSYLLHRAEGGEMWLNDLIYERRTDRHDITFPWGTTFSTETIVRPIDLGDCTRQVSIFRRPWGSGEIFADQENCSVRILVVEARERLSFQRHLCRDELFVALDDEVGFDISGHDLGTDEIGALDLRIESVSLSQGDYLLVPRGIWHRARASRSRVRLLEVGFGIYDELRDVERRLDLYGRAPRL